MAEGWSHELATEVGERLDVLDQVAAGVASVRVDPDQVRAEVRALVESWRHLLQLHAPDERTGRCARCARSWSWRGRKPWPCGVWRSAHELLVARQDIAPAAAQSVPPPAPVPVPPAGTAWETDPSLSMPLRVRITVPAQPYATALTQDRNGTPGPASPSMPPEVVAGGVGFPLEESTDGDSDERPYGRHAWRVGGAR